MEKKYVLVSCLLVLFIFSTTEFSFADHGSSGGGGSCSGDCAPPTLGEDNSGREYVKGGFSINEKSFEVTHFKQDIPTQIIKTGEPVTITLKIYENGGTQYLSHVGLLFGLEEKIVEGIKVHSHQVQIIWEQDFEGKITMDVIDIEEFVSNVEVENELVRDAFGTEDGLTQLQFKFTPTKPFNTDTILVEMWDYERNSWTNSFYTPIKIEANNLTDDGLSQDTSQLLVPNWFKTNADFWSKNQIDDETFANGIKFLIKEKIMNIPNLEQFKPKPQLQFIEEEKGPQHYIDRYYNDEFYKEWFDENYPEYTIEEAVGYVELEIPDWVKINAELWTTNMISDEEFIAGIEYLIENGIILL